MTYTEPPHPRGSRTKMNEFIVYETKWEPGVFKVELGPELVFDEDMHRVITKLEPGQYVVLPKREYEDLKWPIHFQT